MDKNEELQNEVMTIEQAAQFLQISVAVLRRLIKNGEVPHRMLAGKYRFSRTALVEWMKQGDQPKMDK